MKKLIVKLLLVVLVSIFVMDSTAQVYNNEWIDFTKTYYKFKVVTTGICRIPKAALATVGMDNADVADFKLFRNGQEVPLYTGVTSGPLPANGYIEFWSKRNDGKPDKALYRDPNSQHSDDASLETDSSTYFLTVKPGLNLRYISATSNVAGNALPAEPYFMYNYRRQFYDQMNSGIAAVLGEYVYSSSYDKGEFFSSVDLYPDQGTYTGLTDKAPDLHPFLSGPASTFRIGAAGNALYARQWQVKLNGTEIVPKVPGEMDFFSDVVKQKNFSTALLSSDPAANLEFHSSASSDNDRMVFSFYQITYPRKFDFNNAENFVFELPAKNSGYFLQIDNFNAGGIAPVLFDEATRERYVGDISVPGKVQFALSGSGVARKMILVSSAANNIVTVTKLTQRIFTNFNAQVNQGDYIIISNPLLYNGTGGQNPIIAYKNYRASAAGGSFNPIIIETEQLVDQFAFGIKGHPLSIKNFMNYARSRFNTLPKNVFLIGKGVDYPEARAAENNPILVASDLVPTFGYPGSDNMLSSVDNINNIPATPIGRLSVVTPQEVENYLEKIKEYESTFATAPNTIEGKAWWKNITLVTGSSDQYLGLQLCNYMDQYKTIVSDTLTGSKVNVFCKNSSNPVEQLSSDKIAELFHEGMNMLTYFGHSSSTTLEFNIEDPQKYENQGKYPIFSVNGCNAGNFFVFDPGRFTGNQTLSEKFVLAKQRGAIAFVASTHFGIVSYLNIYIDALFSNMAHDYYGASLGEIFRQSTKRLVTVAGPSDFYARLHAEELTVHGDPAIRLYQQALPDYVIEEPQVVISPSFVSVAQSNFTVKIQMYNIGKSIKDSIVVDVKRQFPDGSTGIIFRQKIKGIYYSDSLSFTLPIIATRDKGLNKIIVNLDADNATAEMSETNNTVTKEFFIYEDEASPVYPYQYSIVNNPAQKLYASIANPFSASKTYVMEIDTSGLFNSAAKRSQQINSIGGVLEFSPQIPLQDSTVYYWRVALVPVAGTDYHWNASSFIFLKASSPGFNQSHYFQHLESGFDGLKVTTTRNWEFNTKNNDFYIRNTMFPTGGTEGNMFSNQINGEIVNYSACVGRSITFTVLNPKTLIPWMNVDSLGNNLYLFGSLGSNCDPSRYSNFEFSYLDPTQRQHMVELMDAIPDGYVVFVKSFDYDYNKSFSATWRGDTSFMGHDRSLYHSLLNAGFRDIDSINQPRAWNFVYKKNDTSFAPLASYTVGIYDHTLVSGTLVTPGFKGSVTSPAFGPAKKWNQLHWRGKSVENAPTDNVRIDLIGTTPAGIDTTLITFGQVSDDVDISFVNAAIYPFLKIRMNTLDTISLTPNQLQYWRLDYDPVPEGALAANIFLQSKDSLEVGEPFNFGIAFKNVSPTAFDSLKIKFAIVDKDNVSHLISLPKGKPLVAGDTITLRYSIDTKSYIGANTLQIDFNPDNDQLEQFHFNNFLFKSFYVKGDRTNPLLDVTFDNIHILDQDIVSSKPQIQIKLKDDAKYLLLNDTSLITTLQVQYPDANRTIRTFKFGTDTLRFIPATNGANNAAVIEFNPYFPTLLDQGGKPLNPSGDEYELFVRGKDRSDNKSGAVDYHISFRVIDKPMISNLLNYPNPFTTSTAFVFTITGSDIPENFKVQILTVTGKIVREITREELGPLHIGRNITEFKWNGTDQFGQRLGNGVYLYRVVTTLNGKRMDKFTDKHDDTDKYFNNGYGKMYLMR